MTFSNSLKNVIAICGSTRTNSVNLSFITAISELAKNKFNVVLFNNIADIPHFNPDIDNDNPPEKVKQFRSLLQTADGILICTPEYAMGVPGTLKNAIDWTVSSCEFSKKPTALITASSVGEKGHAALKETLSIIEAEMTEETQLLIPFAKTKIDANNTIKDAKTMEQVIDLIETLLNLITKKNAYEKNI